MQFSEEWLRELTNPAVSSDDLVEMLTMAGLEVDSVSPVAGQFSKIYVAEVISTEAHPDADKLTLCQVSLGGDELVQIVCGAANVRAGIKVPCAVVGAKLPGDFKIKKAKLRGQESSGMLCSVEELGLEESAEGLFELPADAPVGEDVRDYLGLDDLIIDVDLTPNRGDCLSMQGLARELGVLTRSAVKEVSVSPVEPVHDEVLSVSVSAPEVCPRYIGRVIKGIDNTVETPLWMKEKLRRGGVRQIDPVVDVTNYVLLELGQPLHAFDTDKLSGGIDVRLSVEGEKITLLDGQEVSLDEGTALICDDDALLAIAGVMGGADSAVATGSRHIFLESAFFKPSAIAGKARHYGLHTDSSHRFERGVDYQLQEKAIERATQLIIEITGGEPGPLVELTNSEKLPEARQILLRAERIERILGFSLAANDVEEILTRLGFDVSKQSEGEWLVSSLSYRFDITVEEDLIEELARVNGYNNIPVRMPVASLFPVNQAERICPVSRVKHALVDLDYLEVITYSFVDFKMQNLIDPDQIPLSLINPISSDMGVMRTSLWPGLIKAVQHNQNRQHSRIRMFETGTRFVLEDGEYKEEQVVAGLICGARQAENWTGSQESVDFFDIKGDVEDLLALNLSGTELRFDSGEYSALHPGQAASVFKQGKAIGQLGALHPKLLKTLQLNGPIYLFELQLSEVCEGSLPAFEEISKFPGVRRDLALLVDENQLSGELIDGIRKTAGNLLRDVTLFDVYTGKGVAEGYKSLAIALFFQHAERTLDENEVNEVIADMLASLNTEFNAILRE